MLMWNEREFVFKGKRQTCVQTTDKKKDKKKKDYYKVWIDKTLYKNIYYIVSSEICFVSTWFLLTITSRFWFCLSFHGIIAKRNLCSNKKN